MHVSHFIQLDSILLLQKTGLYMHSYCRSYQTAGPTAVQTFLTKVANRFGVTKAQVVECKNTKTAAVAEKTLTTRSDSIPSAKRTITTSSKSVELCVNQQTQRAGALKQKNQVHQTVKGAIDNEQKFKCLFLIEHVLLH